jgi:hypothetical protein
MMLVASRLFPAFLSLSTALLMWVSYPNGVQAGGAQSKADLKQFAALYEGEFDNYQEVTAVREQARPQVHLNIQRVTAPALGEYVFLVRAQRAGKPFVRRLDSFRLNAAQQIEAVSYSFASDEQALALERDLDTLANMKSEQLRPLIGCPTTWQRVGTQFSGLCAANGEQPSALASLTQDELHLPQHTDAVFGGHFRRCVLYEGEVTHISETGKRQKPFAMLIHNQGQSVPLTGSNFVLQMTEAKDKEGQAAVKVGLWEDGKELVSALAKASQVRFRFITEVVEVRLTKQKRD